MCAPLSLCSTYFELQHDSTWPRAFTSPNQLSGELERRVLALESNCHVLLHGLILYHPLRCESRSSRKGKFPPLPGLFLSTDLSQDPMEGISQEDLNGSHIYSITLCLNGYTKLPLGLPCDGLTTHPGCVLTSYTVSPG